MNRGELIVDHDSSLTITVKSAAARLGDVEESASFPAQRELTLKPAGTSKSVNKFGSWQASGKDELNRDRIRAKRFAT